LRLLAWWIAAGIQLIAVASRRRWPVLAFAAALGMSIVHAWVALLPQEPVDLAVLICLFTVADRKPRIPSIAAAFLGVAVALVAGQAIGSGNPFGYWQHTSITSVLLIAVAWFAGDNARVRRDHLRQAERRADDAERDRDRQAQLAAAAERERITRELHDVVAHSLSVMVIQAQGGDAALDADLGKTRAALRSILATGREALAEMRRLLGIERGLADTAPALAPQPGLDQLPRFLDELRQAGLRVSLTITGTPHRLDAGSDLSAFRIIQESLTNTLKHVGPAADATVELTYRSDGVEIDVTNSAQSHPAGNPAAAGQPGHGLRGMRERVQLLGGHLETGPVTGGGFRVHARIPVFTGNWIGDR
jgi:signal transduction histidine kinase